jgi:PhnB protein
MAKPIPDGYRTVTPYLTVKGAAQAIDFYKRAFGAQEIERMTGPDGKSVMHAEIKIGDSIVMLTDEMPQMGTRSPQTLGGTTASVFLYVPDVDSAFKRAVDAGAKATMPPADMFWGDRFGKLVDPFGHEWGMATHKEDLSPEEVRKRAAAAMASMGKAGA